MGTIWDTVGYKILRAIAPPQSGLVSRKDKQDGKLENLFGTSIWERIAGKTVIDFGCGWGHQAIEMAQHGAAHVIGIDIQDNCLDSARSEARRLGLTNCSFSTATDHQADIIISLDAFEHFSDSPAVLKTMARLLKRNGIAMISWGPPWYHPLGGHLFSVFPWAHLIFSETSLCRWRKTVRSDEAKRFRDAGLNQMTIKRFENIVSQSPFQVQRAEIVSIRRLRWVATRLTREWTTATVRYMLVNV